jgi:SAM-dependent methyltransferase
MAPPPPAASTAAPPAAPAGPGAATDDEKARAVAIFRQTWDVYTKVVEHDYMSHVLLFDGLSKDMLARHGGNEKPSFSIVDLGCGGADALAATLRRSPELAKSINSYTGVDLSDIALAHARANMLGGPVQGGFPDVRSSSPDDGALPSSSCAAEFVEADMVSFAQRLPEKSADVILAAFALHHLTPEQKEAVVKAAARALKPGGTFYYLDVWMRDDEAETRDSYLARYKALMSGWDALSERESSFIWDHVSAFDFPAREKEVAGTPHFEKVEVVVRDGGPHALMRLTGPRL